MKVTFDVEKLNKLMLDFYNCTNITITLFDSELNHITDVGTWQPYCLEIGKNVDLLERCRGCNRDNCMKAQSQKSTLVYTCHAGIVESVTPIFYEDTLIAYLMLGKFRDAEMELSSPQCIIDTAERYGLNKQVMLSAYEKLPLLTKSYINSAISILEACICYMSKENLFHLHRNEFSSRIEEYIEEHISSEITVSELCKKFNVPKQILYSIFKLEFNDTVGNYILKKRLHKAQLLLVDTNISVSDIATSVGFEDYNYFIRIFKKKVGTSPLQYRKQNNK